MRLVLGVDLSLCRRVTGSPGRRYGAPVPADVPTILATSHGRRAAARLPWEVGPLTRYAVELAGVTGRAPRVCFLGTACGDDSRLIATFYDNAWREGWSASHIALFPMPNVADLRQHLVSQDVVWVWGGSVAGLLAMWRLHGLDVAVRDAWQAGVVLTGVSAGSICWHTGGPTDSFGPALRVVTNGLGLLPWSNGVHYNSEPERRPLFQSLIADGTLPPGYATDDGVGLLYRGTEMVEALAEIEGSAAYHVERVAENTAQETRLKARLIA
jgi:peptidase E